MNCEDCGTRTVVRSTYDDGGTVHRKRQCPSCGWYCVSQEKFVDAYYCVNSLRERERKRDEHQAD
jgi:transcriptional regulator NrdR family protein